ncbi:hypothetical protein [Streptomyces sp. NPDC058374]|uniref:hypothetical protein n=1 Tax=unclassified Streptomyces TaxID=2593676 RepID=UPI00364D4C0D
MGGEAERDGSSLSDADWERFLRESVAGTTDAPKEPSARARSVAHRLKGQEPPEGWRTYTPARSKRRKTWYVLGLLVAAALLAVALAPGQVAGLFGGGASQAPVKSPQSGSPEQAPPTEAALRPTLDDPFRGSPAARWESGVTGISMPEAEATGWMDAAQVKRALEHSRTFLAASNLDPGVLRGERPKKATALVNPHQEDVRAYLADAFRAPDEKDDPLLLFSRFEESRTRLVGDEVRTRGRLTYREGERGALEVTADVTFVYPVTRAAAGGEEVVRTVVRRETVMSWDDPAEVLTEPGTFSLLSYRLHVTNGGCAASTGFFTPPFGTGRAATGDGPEVDPYDRSGPLDRHAGDGPACDTATRS